MSRPIFSPGDRVGVLTIVRRVGLSPGRCVLWEVECDCGTTLTIPSNRLSGRVRSCGCLPLAPGSSGHKPRTGFPSQQELSRVLDYDPSTGVFRWKGPANWRRRMDGVAGSRDSNGYIHIRLDGVTYKAHHLAWIYVYGEMHLMPETDHKDGDRSNNAITNLRPCSHADNQANQKGRRNTTGLPKGVRRNPRGKPFTARITFQKRQILIGRFDTIEEAARAYHVAAQKFYGEFARQDAVTAP